MDINMKKSNEPSNLFPCHIVQYQRPNWDMQGLLHFSQGAVYKARKRKMSQSTKAGVSSHRSPFQQPWDLYATVPAVCSWIRSVRGEHEPLEPLALLTVLDSQPGEGRWLKRGPGSLPRQKDLTNPQSCPPSGFWLCPCVMPNSP